MRFSKLILTVGLLASCHSVLAGQYECASYGDVGCAEHIRNIVTDKFTAKFPHGKYEIVVVYDYHAYSSGGGVGFAIAGVSPKVSVPKKYDGMSLMPIRRFTVTSREAGEWVDAYQVTKNKQALIVRAVEHMMEACDRDASCNIMDAP